jgi:hypothetical protein
LKAAWMVDYMVAEMAAEMVDMSANRMDSK